MALTTDLEAVARAVCAQKGFTFLGPTGKGQSKETFHITLPTGEERALKVLRPNTSLQRLQREIDAMTACNHPNIGRLYSIESITVHGTNHWFTVEEYVSGGSLQQRLELSNLTRSEVLLLGSKLIGALAHLENRDLVHRDLAPKNILFLADGQTPVIVDFGIVRNLNQTSLTNAWQDRGPCTPFYASPEQLNNEKDLIDWRSDQFGLGVVLGESLLAVHPFARSGDTPNEVVDRVAARETISDDFVNACETHRLPVLLRMLAVWPVDRVRTPSQLQTLWDSQER